MDVQIPEGLLVTELSPILTGLFTLTAHNVINKYGKDIITMLIYEWIYWERISNSRSNMSDLLTIKEAASYLRMSPLTLYRMASKGILPAVKVGRHWRIHNNALESWLRPMAPRSTSYIMVVDDDEAVRSLFRGTLERGGNSDYQVVPASNGDEALSAMESFEFSLIFLDLRMPGMDGVETFGRIRQVDSLVPVVVITGYPDSDLMARALGIGPVGVMMKPFDSQDIEQTVRSFARRPEVVGYNGTGTTIHRQIHE